MKTAEIYMDKALKVANHYAQTRYNEDILYFLTAIAKADWNHLIRIKEDKDFYHGLTVELGQAHEKGDRLCTAARALIICLEKGLRWTT